MKRIILCISIAVISFALYSQEEIIGRSYFDLQTNGSCQNRIYLFDDGTIGTTWTRGMNFSTYADRGTGYNYFDGSSWQPWPEERIESQRSGWPSYAPYGESGEIMVTHLSGADTIGLLFNKRPIKGTGNWTESLFTGPEGFEEIYWPRMVTGGIDHNIIYLLVLTAPYDNGGSAYQGLDGALLYSRSMNGGSTWDIQNQILPGMGSTEYNGFIGDCYAFAEPKDNIVAFVVGSNKTDMFLMKSMNYGQTFNKTIIWDNPYDTILPADTFYCVDGSMAVSLDESGKTHVAFGINHCWYNNNNWITDRSVDGVGYWNEDRESFSQDLNALNPYNHPNSELLKDYSLIGWSQDIDGDGEITYVENEFGYGSYGISSMVQLVTDDQNRLFIFFTSVTETYDNGMLNYRRLWSRSSLDGGETWGQFYHFLENDPSMIFKEFAFPSCAARSDDFINLIVMLDIEPGIYNQPSENITMNDFKFIKVLKDSIVGINQPDLATGFDVSQNFPNPFSQTAIVTVNLNKPTELTLDVMNLLGQRVMQTQTIYCKQGVNYITIEKNSLTPGIYFYTVQSGEQTITKKMIIN